MFSCVLLTILLTSRVSKPGPDPCPAACPTVHPVRCSQPSCVRSFGFLKMHSAHSSTFPASLFFSPSSCLFYMTMPRHKLEPGKLDYHGDSIFRIPPSYGPFGAAEQKQRHPQVGRLCNNWALPTGHALRYSRHATVIDLTQSYFSVCLPTISSIGAQIKRIP